MYLNALQSILTQNTCFTTEVNFPNRMSSVIF